MKSVAILGQLQKSTSRMADLIRDMLDFARGRLGGGFSLNRDPACLLGPVLELVVDELRTAWPGRSIETTFCLKHPVDCDPARIAQLLSNLAGNALKHGSGTVKISADAANGIFELAVENDISRPGDCWRIDVLDGADRMRDLVAGGDRVGRPGDRLGDERAVLELERGRPVGFVAGHITELDADRAEDWRGECDRAIGDFADLAVQLVAVFQHDLIRPSQAAGK